MKERSTTPPTVAPLAEVHPSLGPGTLAVLLVFNTFPCISLVLLVWANYKDDTYVGTLDGSFQLPWRATDTISCGFWGLATYELFSIHTGGSFQYILKRAPVCWNFEPFVSAPSDSYRHELKTHKRYHLGAHFGHKTPPNTWGFKVV